MESDAMTWNEVAASIIDDDRGKWDRKLPAASLSVGQNGQLVTMNGGPAAEPYVLSELATGHQPAPLRRRLRPARALPQRPGCRRARAEPGDDAGQRFARRAGRGGVDAGGQSAAAPAPAVARWDTARIRCATHRPRHAIATPMR